MSIQVFDLFLVVKSNIKWAIHTNTHTHRLTRNEVNFNNNFIVVHFFYSFPAWIRPAMLDSPIYQIKCIENRWKKVSNSLWWWLVNPAWENRHSLIAYSWRICTRNVLSQMQLVSKGSQKTLIAIANLNDTIFVSQKSKSKRWNWMHQRLKLKNVA